MPAPDRVLLVGSLALLLPAVATDLRWRRIPNFWTATGFVAALGIRGAQGLDPFLSGVGAAVIAFAVLVPFFRIGAMGGGDVKLATAAGAFAGMGRVLPALVAMSLAGGLMALGAAWWRGRLQATLAGVHAAWWTLRGEIPSTHAGAAPGSAPPVAPMAHAADAADAIRIPYAVAIAAGSGMGWWLG